MVVKMISHEFALPIHDCPLHFLPVDNQLYPPNETLEQSDARSCPGRILHRHLSGVCKGNTAKGCRQVEGVAAFPRF